MGVAQYEAGGGAPGWWASESCAMEALSVAHEASHGEKGVELSSGAIALADLLDVSRTGYAFLELHYQARNGKKYEELLAVATSSTPSHSLSLRPLDMAERSAPTAASSASSAPTASSADAHGSMISTLPFNLGETSDQRQRRETVPLPYAYHQNAAEAAAEGAASLRGTTGQAKIFFEAEDDDDEDDEDPDDDLDL